MIDTFDTILSGIGDYLGALHSRGQDRTARRVRNMFNWAVDAEGIFMGVNDHGPGRVGRIVCYSDKRLQSYAYTMGFDADGWTREQMLTALGVALPLSSEMS